MSIWQYIYKLHLQVMSIWQYIYKLYLQVMSIWQYIYKLYLQVMSIWQYIYKLHLQVMSIWQYIFMPASNQNLDFQQHMSWSFLYSVSSVLMRDDCSFGWYCWWPSLCKLIITNQNNMKPCDKILQILCFLYRGFLLNKESTEPIVSKW
jgi:hypothetical protein